MKQLLQTILLGLSIGVSAGNLYENPGFETWNDSDDLPSSRQWRWGLPKGKQKAFERFARSTKEKFSGTASLHLKDSDSGRSNSSLGFIIGGKEVKRYAGKVLYFSARVKQISASAPGTVGISLFIKDADDKVVTVSAGVDATGQTDW